MTKRDEEKPYENIKTVYIPIWLPIILNSIDKIVIIFTFQLERIVLHFLH